MALSVTCDECFSTFDAPEKARGKRVRCPHCSAAVRVGGGGGSSASMRSQGGPRRKSAPAQKAGGPPMGLLIGGGLAALVIMGGGMLGLGILLAGGDSPAVAQNTVVTPAANTGTETVAQNASQSVASPSEPAADDASAGESNTPAREEEPSRAVPDRSRNREPRKPRGGIVGSLGGGLGSSPSESEDGSAPESGGPDEEEGQRGSDKPPVAVASEDGLLPERTDRLNGAEMVSTVMPSVVRINNTGPRSRSQGSGYVVHPSGIVVTNYHVVAEANRIDVEFQNGKRYDSPGYLLVEPQYDIAIIKLDLKGDESVPAVPIRSEIPAQGSEVMTFGTPRGFNFSSTKGSISAVRDEEEIRNKTNSDHRGTWIQFDASISSGNSGGPLCDMNGNVIGMNTFVWQPPGGVAQSLNFAISCVDIGEKVRGALQKYDGENVEPWDADALKEFDGDLGRKLVENEIGTNKGKRILAGMSEVLIIPYQYGNDPSLSGVQRYVDSQAEKAIESLGMNIVWKRPERMDLAIMVIKMDVEKKSRTSDTMLVSLYAEVIVPDIEDDSQQNLFCRVWTYESEIGTLSPRSVATGKVPRGWNIRLLNFFGNFKRVFREAQKQAEEGELDSDTEMDGSRIAGEGSEGLFEELFGDIFALPEPGGDVGRGPGRGRGRPPGNAPPRRDGPGDSGPRDGPPRG
ncbi:MAG: trypsin-like peptidase domain-containing protein, partial [Planctomycetota bacterium]